MSNIINYLSEIKFNNEMDKMLRYWNEIKSKEMIRFFIDGNLAFNECVISVLGKDVYKFNFLGCKIPDHVREDYVIEESKYSFCEIKLFLLDDYLIGNDSITIQLYDEGFHILDDDNDTLQKLKFYNNISVTDELIKALICIYTIQQKALNQKKEVMQIISDVPRETKEKTNYKPAHHAINLGNSVTFTHVYDDVRHYDRHTEAWSVRGFYRHYKNGKVVFIAPHTRGAGVIKDKHYII